MDINFMPFITVIIEQNKCEYNNLLNRVLIKKQGIIMCRNV